ALPTHEHRGLAAHRTVGTDRAVHAAREQGRGALTPAGAHAGGQLERASQAMCSAAFTATSASASFIYAPGGEPPRRYRSSIPRKLAWSGRLPASGTACGAEMSATGGRWRAPTAASSVHGPPRATAIPTASAVKRAPSTRSTPVAP